MGDSGALYSGVLLATLSITGIMKNSSSAVMYLPFMILAVPILDVAFSSIRRIMKGSSPFVADSEHIHHKLLHHGCSQDKVVLILATFAMGCAIISILIAGSFSRYYINAVVLVAVLLILNMISKTIKKSDKNE